MPERYKDEIEDILRQAEGVLSQERTEPPTPMRRNRRYVLRLPKIGPVGGWPPISAGKVMLAALALFLAAMVLKATSGPVMLFVWIGLALFVVAYIMFFSRPRSLRVEKRWRGRLVEDESSDLWGRLKRWLKGAR